MAHSPEFTDYALKPQITDFLYIETISIQTCQRSFSENINSTLFSSSHFA